MSSPADQASFWDTYEELDFVQIAHWISGEQAFRGIDRGDRSPSQRGTAEGDSAPAAEPPGEEQVLAALARPPGTLEPRDLAALVSPAAATHLEALAHAAEATTRLRFGRVVQLYAPLYLSNECASICTYCGFRRDNDIARRTLTVEEALRDARVLRDQGLQHVLLLTGEDYRHTPLEYLEECVRAFAEEFHSVSIEVYPLDEDGYERLRAAGADGLAVYQETYDRARYQEVHVGGMKKRLRYRLECPERGARAGLRKLAIGALLGLSDPAAEVFFVGLHARFLMKHFWRSQLSISLPRLRPAAGFASVPALGDRAYVQYLTALRLFLPDVGLTVSTREPPAMRDNLARICATTLSAGSRTDPGGYTSGGAGEQFSIDDSRSVAEVAAALRELALEPLFTDWAHVMK